MYDWGPLNQTAPHRNDGILFPSTSVMGTGDAPAASGFPAVNAIWNADPSFANSDLNHAVPLVMWPSKGYIPHFLVPGRWSAFVPDNSQTTPCDLSRVTVSITKDGTPIGIKASPSPNGGVVVWTLDATDEGDSDTQIKSFSFQSELFGWARPNFQNDIIYHVTIDGIRVPHLDSNYNELGDGPFYTGGAVINGHFEYDVVGYNPNVAVIDPHNQSNLVNISTRSFAGDESSTQIAGFIISGSSPRKVLIRAGGPYLLGFGVNNVLSDPQLTLFDGSHPFASNDDWSTDAANIRAATLAAGALAFSEDSKDAAIVATLQPGHAYTAHVTGKNGESGNAIVEVYDVLPDETSRLVNISTRSFVGTGQSIQIGGFILHGAGPRKVLIRAGGSYLTQFGVANVLADPLLSVFEGQIEIASNDDWGTDRASVSSAVEAVGVPQFQVGSKDAALVLTLDPDKPYTAQISSKSGATGNALVEIFQLP